MNQFPGKREGRKYRALLAIHQAGNRYAPLGQQSFWSEEHEAASNLVTMTAAQYWVYGLIVKATHGSNVGAIHLSAF